MLDINAKSDQAGVQGTNLADLILAQIAAHEVSQEGGPVIHGGGLPEDAVELPAKVVEVYQKYVNLPGITPHHVDLVIESDSYCRDINQANYQNPSR